MALSMTMSAKSDPAVEHQPCAECEPVASSDRTVFKSRSRLTSSDRIDMARAEMTAFLNLMHPSTDAEALQTLRKAFPTVPLDERINAIRTRFFA
jgi:hypothetical protein